MFYMYFLALLLLCIRYEKCNTSITPSLEFTRLSNANNSFLCIQYHSQAHRSSSITSSQTYYGPFCHLSKTIALNQCHHKSIGLMTLNSFIGRMTQYDFIGPLTQPNFIGSMTQYNFIHSMTWQVFLGLVTSLDCHCPMIQISGNAETFLYQSQYTSSALFDSFSHFEYQNIQIPGKRIIQILDHSQIELIFCPISLAEMFHFLRSLSAQFLQKFKKRLTFSHNWIFTNQNKNLLVLNLHDVKLLIKHILMKLGRYVTRSHDFACYWRSLPFHGLLKSQHMFFIVLIVLFRLMYFFFINMFIIVILLTDKVIFLINSYIFLHILLIKLLIYLYMMIQNLLILLWRFGIAISRNKKKNSITYTFATDVLL